MSGVTSPTGGAALGPLVSFLIVTRNAGGFLTHCLRSAFGQTHPRVEVVLVDNASTDGSVEKAVKEMGGLEGLRVVRSEKNLGPAGGAVLGLPHCRGEFIARLDADDVALPERIERQIAYMARHPEKEAVGSDVLMIDREGRPLAPRLALRTEFLRQYGSKWEVGTNHTTLLLRRSATRERFYNPTLFATEDYEFIQWLAAQGRLGRAPGRLGLYRRHPGSISQHHSTIQRLNGAELRLRVSQAAADLTRRRQLAQMDFSSLNNDPRLQRPVRDNVEGFMRDCLEKKHYLGAAYFASTSGRWGRFFLLLARALANGVPWREVAGLLLVRTAWPVWKRIHGKLWRFCGAR
jgi:glycosyltransferase involved in cell wall biosynthesis